MKKLYRMKGKLSLFFVVAIAVLCTGFLIVSCGNSPQQKTEETNKGAYALDFSNCPGEPCYGDARGNVPDEILNEKEFTVEAWVKRETGDNLNGGIFGFLRAKGAVLFVKNNVPKLGIRRTPVDGTDVLEANKTALSECIALGLDFDTATTTECFVPAISEAGYNTEDVPATLLTPSVTSTVTVSAVVINSASPDTSFTNTTTGDIITLDPPATDVDGIILEASTSAALSPLDFLASFVSNGGHDQNGFTHVSSTPIRATSYPTAGNTFTYVDPDSNPPDMGFTITLNSGTARGITLLPQTFGAANTPPDTWTNITVYNADDEWPITVTTINAHTAVTLDVNKWTHIAAVLTKENQSSGPNRCATVGAEKPHMAIYINGELNNCASSGSEYAESPAADGEGEKPFTFGLIGDTTLALDVFSGDGGVTTGMNFNGAIDEVRVWGVARTSAQIRACKNQELTIGGTCDRNDSLVGYWRFNEGEGSDITDISGNRYTGTLLFFPGVEEHYEGAWTSGVPGLLQSE